MPSKAFTLPEGYRPDWRLITNQITAGGIGRVDFYEATHSSSPGAVQIANGSASWIGINMSFYIGQ